MPAVGLKLLRTLKSVYYDVYSGMSTLIMRFYSKYIFYFQRDNTKQKDDLL